MFFDDFRRLCLCFFFSFLCALDFLCRFLFSLWLESSWLSSESLSLVVDSSSNALSCSILKDQDFQLSLWFCFLLTGVTLAWHWRDILQWHDIVNNIQWHETNDMLLLVLSAVINNCGFIYTENFAITFFPRKTFPTGMHAHIMSNLCIFFSVYSNFSWGPLQQNLLIFVNNFHCCTFTYLSLYKVK